MGSTPTGRNIAVVTGASSGIGRELALLCAGSGYDIVLVARRTRALARVAEEITRTGRQAFVHGCDLSSASDRDALFASVAELAPEIDILINNAGFGARGRFEEIGVAPQLEMLEVNVLALTHLTGLFVPGMIRRGQGRILNVASTAAFQPGPLMAVYYASKAYVLSFSEALHSELSDHGITVTALCPGPTQTEFQQRAGLEGSRLFRGNPMDAESVARAGFDAMMKGKACVIPGFRNAALAFSTRFASRRLTARVARSLQES